MVKIPGGMLCEAHVLATSQHKKARDGDYFSGFMFTERQIRCGMPLEASVFHLAGGLLFSNGIHNVTMRDGIMGVNVLM